MPRSGYHAHIAKHVRGSAKPREAFAEAARLWRGGATQANPGSGDQVTQVAIAAVLLWLGYEWLQANKDTIAAGVGAITAGNQQPAHSLDCGCWQCVQNRQVSAWV